MDWNESTKTDTLKSPSVAFNYVMEPFTNEGKSNGAEMKEWLVTDHDNGECGVVTLMKDICGDSFVTELANIVKSYHTINKTTNF